MVSLKVSALQFPKVVPLHTVTLHTVTLGQQSPLFSQNK